MSFGPLINHKAGLRQRVISHSGMHHGSPAETSCSSESSGSSTAGQACCRGCMGRGRRPREGGGELGWHRSEQVRLAVAWRGVEMGHVEFEVLVLSFKKKYPVARDGTGTVYGTVRYGTVLHVRRASSNFPLSRAGAITLGSVRKLRFLIQD